MDTFVEWLRYQRNQRPYLPALDGMPLGIELAAAWVRTLSCDEIAQEIECGLGFAYRGLGLIEQARGEHSEAVDMSHNTSVPL